MTGAAERISPSEDLFFVVGKATTSAKSVDTITFKIDLRQEVI